MPTFTFCTIKVTNCDGKTSTHLLYGKDVMDEFILHAILCENVKSLTAYDTRTGEVWFQADGKKTYVLDGNVVAND